MTSLAHVDGGRVNASRRQLDALIAWSRGEGAPDDPVVADLRAAGLIVDGVVHPALTPVVGVLRAVSHRAALRMWCHGRRPVAEVFVGAAGILVLPGGHELDAPQDLRWHPRPTAVARVLAETMAVPVRDGPPVLGAGPRRWSDLVALASGSEGVSLVDLRWSARPGAPLVSVLVAAWAPDAGLVEVVPMDGSPGWVTCRPRHPVEVWTGLTALAAASEGGVRTGRLVVEREPTPGGG